MSGDGDRAAGIVLFQDQRLQVRVCSVNRVSEAGASTADDNYVIHFDFSPLIRFSSAPARYNSAGIVALPAGRFGMLAAKLVRCFVRASVDPDKLLRL